MNLGWRAAKSTKMTEISEHLSVIAPCQSRAARGLLDWTQDHLAQAAWNIFAIMHHQAVGPDGLDDMPKYERIDG